MSTRRSSYRLRSWLLLALLPSIGAFGLVFAVANFRGLRAIILEGFDRKLTAVSTGTAAFINPADHQQLFEPPAIAGVVPNPTGGGWWSVHLETGNFLRLDATTGRYESTDLRAPTAFTHIAAAETPGEVFLADGETGILTRVNLATGNAGETVTLEPPLYAFATDQAEARLYVASREFLWIDLASGVTTVLPPLPFRPRGMAFDDSRRAVWLLDEAGETLLEVDADSGTVRSRVTLTAPKAPAESAGPTYFAPGLPVRVVALGIEPGTHRLFGFGTSMLTIDPATGHVDLGARAPAYGRERGPIYREYVPYLRAVHNQVGTRYLYTQKVQNLTVITYGLDAGIGDDHSPLLSVDELPPEAIAPVQRLQVNGDRYVGPITPWEQWGLLKAAFAPIFDAEGEVVAMAGADIDVTTIEADLHRALVVTIGAGVAMLLVAGLFSLYAARRLTAPLEVIRTSALRVAAGDHTHSMTVTEPRELGLLSRQFNAVSQRLQSVSATLAEALARRQAVRDESALDHRLRQRASDLPSHPDRAWRTPGASGAINAGDLTIVWLAEPTPPGLPSAERGATLAEIARALLHHHADSPTVMARLLTHPPAGSRAWLLISPHGITALTAPTEGLRLQTIGPATVVTCTPAEFNGQIDDRATARTILGQIRGDGFAVVHLRS